MRIIFSNYDDIKNPYYSGGGAHAIHEVAKRLTKNHEVEVITASYPKAKDEVVDAVSYKRVGVPVGAKLGQLVYHLILPFYVKTENFDIWIESFTPPYSTSFLPIFTKKPVIGLAHMLAGADMKRKYKLPFDFVEKLGLKLYKHFIVLTNESRQKIISCRKDAQVAVIPNGVSTNKSKKLSNKKHILFLGRIEVDQKGLDLLLGAFKKIKDKTNVKLVIAGRGTDSEEEKLGKLIEKLNLRGRVRLLGRVDAARKNDLLEHAYFLVAPSRYETFSVVSLEAASFGLPVVSFDIEGLNWFPEKCAFKVKSFDIDKFADVMLKLLSSRPLRERMGRKAKKFSKKYSWDKISHQYEQFILKVANGFSKQNHEAAFNKFLEKLVSKKLRCIFISPHFDDAVFSAGALITFLASRVDVTVINVFTKAGVAPYTLSAWIHLIRCGFLSSETLYRERKKEDEKVLAKLKLKAINLDFEEALYRKRTGGKVITYLGGLLPNLVHLYPTYRFHILGGRVSKEDKGLRKDISKTLRAIIPGDGKSLIFCPIGIGKHVDHTLVRDVCRESFKNVICWADYPYLVNVAEDSLNIRGYKNYEFSQNLEYKKVLISGYKTQVSRLTQSYSLPKEIFFVKDKMKL